MNSYARTLFFWFWFFFYWIFKKMKSCCRYCRTNRHNAILRNDDIQQVNEIQPLISDDDCVFADRINNPNDYDEQLNELYHMITFLVQLIPKLMKLVQQLMQLMEVLLLQGFLQVLKISFHISLELRTLTVLWRVYYNDHNTLQAICMLMNTALLSHFLYTCGVPIIIVINILELIMKIIIKIIILRLII